MDYADVSSNGGKLLKHLLKGTYNSPPSPRHMLLQGFEEEDFSSIENTTTLAFEEAYPSCRVLPSSKLTVNQTGIDNGDIRYFSLSFFVRSMGGRGKCKR